jgi:RNA polymerase sigma-70 factor (ECF subfamily)
MVSSLHGLDLPGEADSPVEAYALEEEAPVALERCDRAQLAALYGEIAPSVHRFLCDLLGDAALAADAMQETFVRAFRRVDEVPPGVRLTAWIFGIARRVSLEARRARTRARRVIDDGRDDVSETSCPDTAARSPEAALLDREALRIVNGALDRLSDDRRAVLLLRLDHGLAYDEIAELMSWSLAKVKVEIHRAREVLRATLVDYRGGVR